MSTVTEYRIDYVGDDGELYETYKYDNDFTTGIDGPIYMVHAQKWAKDETGEIVKVGDEGLFLDFSARYEKRAGLLVRR